MTTKDANAVQISLKVRVDLTRDDGTPLRMDPEDAAEMIHQRLQDYLFSGPVLDDEDHSALVDYVLVTDVEAE